MARLLAIACTILLTAPAQGQPAATPAADDIPMADYLGLLAKIAPAAKEGAEAYLLAFQQTCGRHMATAELRRAMSEGSGDPVLMGLIRASQLKDARAIAEWKRRLDCGGRR